MEVHTSMEVDDGMGDIERGKRASEVAQLLNPMVKKRRAANAGAATGEGLQRVGDTDASRYLQVAGPAHEECNRETMDVTRRVRFFHRAVGEALERMDIPSRIARIRILVDALTPLTSPGAVERSRAGGHGVEVLGDMQASDVEREERERDRMGLPGVVELAGMLQVSFFDASSVHRLALEVKALRRRDLDTCGILDTLTSRITGGTLSSTHTRMETLSATTAHCHNLGVGGKRVRDIENVPTVQRRECSTPLPSCSVVTRSPFLL